MPRDAGTASAGVSVEALSTKRVPGRRGAARVDIFKLEHGRIVEHWNVTQSIPEEAENPNGML